MSGSRKCLYIGKDFSGTDVYHSDIKKCVSFALLQINIFLCLLKIIFQNSQNFLRQNASEIEVISSICQKNGKAQAKFQWRI